MAGEQAESLSLPVYMHIVHAHTDRCHQHWTRTVKSVASAFLGSESMQDIAREEAVVFDVHLVRKHMSAHPKRLPY